MRKAFIVAGILWLYAGTIIILAAKNEMPTPPKDKKVNLVIHRVSHK